MSQLSAEPASGALPLPSAKSRPAVTAHADPAVEHLRRFVAPLCKDRAVLDVDRAGGEPRLRRGPKFDVVLALRARWADETPAAKIAAVAGHLGRSGILVLAVKAEATATAELLRAALVGRFRHVRIFRQRAIAGSLVLDERFADARLVPLEDRPGRPQDVDLFVCSDAPLPPLAGALIEGETAPVTSEATGEDATAEARRDLLDRLAAAEVAAEALWRDRRAEQGAHSAALIERLLTVEKHTAALRMRIRELENECEAGIGGDRGDGDEVPQFSVGTTAYGWPLRQNPDRDPTSLGRYDRRPDDAVIAAAKEARAFAKAFGLDGDRPDFAAAVATLNARPRTLALLTDTAGPEPDVSIVIPVYGQLAYTLNCIDSLIGHAARYSVEVIVVDDVSPDASGDHLPAIEAIRYWRQPVNGGFINSCNTGAALARGRYLVMLNNDTRLVDGWLDALIDTFSARPQAGLVGSKLFYDDASLQEAGGILWRDGSPWNYGRNDDPNRPIYCHARQVDYISGCSIALPTALWRELGGFDLRYAPAYCEDSDLCLRVRSGGRQVWFQPTSRLIHYEGKTSGTDLASGIKAYQVVNTKKLFLRWRSVFSAHAPNGREPYFEREREMHSRALVVDATTPTPNQDAGSVTTALTLKNYAEMGYKTHFVPEDNFLFDPIYTPPLMSLGIEVAYAPFELSFEHYMEHYGRLFDVVQIFRVGVLQKTIEIVRKWAPQAPIIFNNMDLHYLRMQRDAELRDDDEARRAAAEMKTHELALVGQVDCTITPSTFERDVLAEEVPGSPVLVWPFMFESFGTEVPFAPRRDVCFLGGYGHTPNVDAVRYFAEEIFPLIRAEEPGCRFIIAGAKPTQEVLDLASDDVVVLGMVDDLRDLFDACRVFVSPLRFGAGVKGKIYAAMSYGLPIVTSTVGVEGTDLTHDRDVLISDDPREFAAMTLEAYRDEALWTRLSERGQRRVREEHSLAMGARVLAEAMDVAYAHRLGLTV